MQCGKCNTANATQQVQHSQINTANATRQMQRSRCNTAHHMQHTCTHHADTHTQASRHQANLGLLSVVSESSVINASAADAQVSLHLTYILIIWTRYGCHASSIIGCAMHEYDNNNVLSMFQVRRTFTPPRFPLTCAHKKNVFQEEYRYKKQKRAHDDVW